MPAVVGPRRLAEGGGIEAYATPLWHEIAKLSHGLSVPAAARSRVKCGWSGLRAAKLCDPSH